MSDDAGTPSDRDGDDAVQPPNPDELRIVEGVARQDGRLPCPACGRAILAGQDIATSLGDVRLGAVGVTVHARCFSAVGRPGLLELMLAAYRDQSTHR